LKPTIQQLEDSFNRRHRYPHVFLNIVPYTEPTKEHIRSMTKAECHFGLIPSEHWSYPNWVVKEKARKSRIEWAVRNAKHAMNESYRFKARYKSGFFFRHPLLNGYDYYWRVDPKTEFPCDIDFDPFQFLHENNDKHFSFIASTREPLEASPTLWDTVQDFAKLHPEYVAENNSMSWVSRANETGRGFCRFVTSLEIGSLKFFRSERFLKFFDYLDRAGGFFYEIWEDSAVHSLAVSLLLRQDQVHFFDEIGFSSASGTHCPTNATLARACACGSESILDSASTSCTPQWMQQVSEGEARIDIIR